MKKKIATIIFVILVATITTWNITQTDNEVKLSNIALSNVEALAEGETITIDCDTWFKENCATIVLNGVTQKIEGRRK